MDIKKLNGKEFPVYAIYLDKNENPLGIKLLYLLTSSEVSEHIERNILLGYNRLHNNNFQTPDNSAILVYSHYSMLEENYYKSFNLKKLFEKYVKENYNA